MPYLPHIRNTPHPRRLQRRATDDSRQTTIIIAVCVGVGTAVILLFIIRVIYRMHARRPSNTAPLPPVQPLAHDRERRLAQLDAWRDSSYPLAVPVTFSSAVGGSKTSLLTKEAESGFQEPSRHASFIHSEQGVDDITVLVSTRPMDPSLPLPNPSFHHDSASSSSLGLGSESDLGSGSPTPPLTPSLSHASFVQPPNSGSRSGSPSTPPPTRTTSRRRPVSSVSAASIRTTRSTRNTIRGTPHSPHSNVQIILPAPLAPEVFHYATNDDGRRSIHSDPSNHIRRMSLADKWAPGSLNAAARQSTLLNNGEQPPRPPRRSSSTPHGLDSRSSPPSAFHAYVNSVPPVPPIPSVHDAHSAIHLPMRAVTRPPNMP
ncbi:hypothetical protein BDN71DRAFT_1441486 [Pleurotus eryngii]|uniref:Uncharacterized protein n=1 Tax=Pleurotus eryngii TaxID=5323 RepID=A0A9P6DIT7_PLEER|nr:hypothetical protein BDN71DRAFT_1441486 [Pleurotus eryngii]